MFIRFGRGSGSGATFFLLGGGVNMGINGMMTALHGKKIKKLLLQIGTIVNSLNGKR